MAWCCAAANNQQQTRTRSESCAGFESRDQSTAERTTPAAAREDAIGRFGRSSRSARRSQFGRRAFACSERVCASVAVAVAVAVAASAKVRISFCYLIFLNFLPTPLLSFSLYVPVAAPVYPSSAIRDLVYMSQQQPTHQSAPPPRCQMPCLSVSVCLLIAKRMDSHRGGPMSRTRLWGVVMLMQPQRLCV